MVVKVEAVGQLFDHSDLCHAKIVKTRGKLTLDDITDALRAKRMSGIWVLAFNLDGDSLYDEDEKGDSCIVTEYAYDCPLCGREVPETHYCPECGYHLVDREGMS